jgi:hypothetical protein
MAVFLGLFFAGALGLSFWILPAGLAALTPLKSREVLGEIRSAFVIALVTTLSVAALPFGVYTAAEVWLSWAPDQCCALYPPRLQLPLFQPPQVHKDRERWSGR